MCDRPDCATAEQLPGLIRSAALAVDAALAGTAPGEDPNVHLIAARYLLDRTVDLLEDHTTTESSTTESSTTRSGGILPTDLDTAIYEIQGLRRAMLTRSVIEQAKGMLMLRLGIDEDQAFTTLSRLSQRTHVKLAEVSHLLVAKGVAEHGQWSRRKVPAEGR